MRSGSRTDRDDRDSPYLRKLTTGSSVSEASYASFVPTSGASPAEVRIVENAAIRQAKRIMAGCTVEFL